MVQTTKYLKLALWYLLWPFAAAYDLVRDRTHDKPNWLVAAILGAVVLFFLGEAIFVAWPSPERTFFIVALSVLYLGLGTGFRLSVREYNLWEF